MAEAIKKRTVKPKSEYSKQLKAFHKKAPKHVVSIEVSATKEDASILLDINEELRIIRNTVLGQLYKRYKEMIRTKKYKHQREEYSKVSLALKQKGLDAKQQKLLEQEKKRLEKEYEALQKEYDVTFEYARKYGEMLRDTKYHKADSVLVWSICEHAYNSINKLLYSSAKKVPFYKKGEYVSFQGKQANRCIILKQNKDGSHYISCMGRKLPLIIKANDLFIHETLANVLHYMNNSESIDQEAVKQFLVGKYINTYRICNNRLVIKEIRGKKRFFLQMTIEGLPVPKRKKDGSFRHTYGTGRIGTDLGTQSLAYTTKDTVVLKNLAERSKNSLSHEHKIYLLQREMDRSKRATNPHKFNKDGTYKKGDKEPWVFSKHYMKLKAKVKELHRKAAVNRKYAHQEDVNKLRALGDHMIIETMSIKGLQKKAKQVTVNKKGKFNKRKRFGKSILRRSPGTFVELAKKRFESTNGLFSQVNTFTYKASQYDHMIDDTKKKGLSKRWHTFNDGLKVQRDLYSSFLLFCSKPTLDAPHNPMCQAYFDNFVKLHNQCVQEIKDKKLNILNSGIKIAM